MNLYDALPYPSHPYVTTHPDRLAAVAALHGLAAPPPDRCRVLELGCAGGGNLLPMAALLPDSSFVGLDLSAVHVAEARRGAEALGLRNATFVHGDLSDAGPELGTFDYVVAHGVYSWVDEDVRRALWSLLASCLAPDGLACVSFNALPGWRVRGAWREMLLYHLAPFEDVETRVAQARAMMSFLGAAVLPEEPWGAFVAHERDLSLDVPPPALLHGLLAPVNDAFTLTGFAERARAHGLDYLADADTAVLAPSTVPRALREDLERWSGDRVAFEQYLDYATNRSFRSAILVRAGRPPTAPDWTRLSRLWVSAALHDADPALDGAPFAFEHIHGETLEVSDPVLKAALAELASRGPEDVGFDALCAATAARLGHEGPALSVLLGENLLSLYAKGHVDLCARRRPDPVTAGSRPAALPWARHQAMRGDDTATNARHAAIPTDALLRAVLILLDGTLDAAQVRAQAIAQALDGRIPVRTPDGERLRDPEAIRAAVGEAVDAQLAGLRRASLLV